MQLNKITLLFILLCIPFLTFSQKNKLEYSAFLIPANLTENANEVIRIDKTIVNVKNESEARISIKKVVTILNDDSNANTFVLHYDSESAIKNISASIYDSMGNALRKMNKDEIQDYSAVGGGTIYGDSRVKYFELNHSDYPYTVEVNYEKRLGGMAFAFFPDWRIQSSPDEAVQSSEFILKTPTTFKIDYRAYHINSEPIVSNENETVSHSWKAENIPALEVEPLIDRNSLKMPYVLINPKKFVVEGYPGSIENWQKFGLFINSLWEGRNVLSPGMKAEIKKMTADATTEREKINRLYRWMQDNMRYVSVQLGIGGWQTFPASYVESNKFGDCKALTNFMMTMLEEVDIKSDPALVYAGSYTPNYEEDFASPRFNHVILNIPSEEYWLECTSNYNPPNYLGRFTEDKTVMIFNREGGKLGHTPKSDAAANLAERKIEVELAMDGSASVKNTSKLYHHRESPWRYYSFEKSDEDLKKYFRENTSLPTFQFESFAVTPNRDEPFTELNFKVKINRYGSKAGKRFFVPINLVSPRSYVPAKLTEDRKNEVVIKNGYTDKDVITISLPTGYKAESIPTGKKEITTEFGSYSLELQQLGNKVICLRNFTIKDVTLPAESYDAVRKFYKDVAKADKMQLVLVKSATEVIRP
ncbi:MAG: hypothetical protein ACI85O_001685 [Saprospiraceae bacterium]|jgi:hypothetical protein